MSHIRGITTGLSLSLLFVFVAGSAVICEFGSLTNGLQYMQGTVAVSDAQMISRKCATLTGKGEAQIRLSNLTWKELTIAGARSDCACLTPTGLPVRIPPRANRWIVAEFDAAIPQAARDLELYVDCGGIRSSILVTVNLQ